MTPYKGPMPYAEPDTERFFGREREIDDIADMVRRNRLSIVVAPSGVGKTSVLLAGVIPALRREHEHELCEGEIVCGPTLVCRDWFGTPADSADAILLAALKTAADQLLQAEKTVFLRPDANEDTVGLKARLEEEASTLRSILQTQESMDSFDEVVRCVDATKGLVLVLDQFEDVLRSPHQKRTLDLIAMIFSHEPRVRVLLSLRREFFMFLHPLEAQIGGLAKRTYYLQSMSTKAVQEIITRPAALNRISISVDAVMTIYQWLGEDGTSERSGNEPFAPSLLSLQALLVDIYEFSEDGGGSNLDATLLRNYQKTRELEPGLLASYSIEIYIDKVLTRGTTGTSSFDKFARGASHSDKQLLLRRLFARLAPALTSGSRPGTPGYKNSVSFSSIVQYILRGDLEMLDVRLPADGIAMSTAFDLQHVTLDSYGRSTDPANTSAAARRLGWSTERTVHVLVAAVGEVLRRLSAGNVVRMIGSGPQAVFELAHDGLGPAVLSWSETFRNTPNDALASHTRVNGLMFRWPTGSLADHLVVDDVCWSGCSIENQQFVAVTFNNCDLPATIFRRCSFIGCSFVDCNLNGVMFVQCRFLPARSPADARPLIRGGSMLSALISRCEIHHAKFEATRMDGSVFDGNDVLGRVDIQRCSLESVIFRDCLLSEDLSSQNDEAIFVKECDVIFTRIISDERRMSIPFYLEPPNQIFPDDVTLLTSNPSRLYRSRQG